MELLEAERGVIGYLAGVTSIQKRLPWVIFGKNYTLSLHLRFSQNTVKPTFIEKRLLNDVCGISGYNASWVEL
jgi:hypothetical protein